MVEVVTCLVVKCWRSESPAFGVGVIFLVFLDNGSCKSVRHPVVKMAMISDEFEESFANDSESLEGRLLFAVPKSESRSKNNW